MRVCLFMESERETFREGADELVMASTRRERHRLDFPVMYFYGNEAKSNLLCEKILIGKENNESDDLQLFSAVILFVAIRWLCSLRWRANWWFSSVAILPRGIEDR